MGEMAARRHLPTYSMLLLFIFAAASVQGFSPKVQAVVPSFGTYFAAAVDWNLWNWSTAGIPSSLGVEPASYVLFTKIPADDGDKWAMNNIMSEIAARGIAVILSPEPVGGLAAVTDAAITEYAAIIAKWEKKGATVIVRFALEMNGSWYPWGQRPTEFIATFRRFAKILRACTKRATMLWGPNVGTGYPYLGQQYLFDCKARPADCAVLDTNRDGQVTETDDMFSPYWPGDDAVDWVGTSLFWWGISWPWGENEVPPPSYFADVLLGKLIQGGVPLPNFYETYAANKNKAMVAETAAMYSLCDNQPDSTGCSASARRGGPSALAVKSAWWEQVYSLQGPDSLRVAMPNIKIVSWFDLRKVEDAVEGNTVDWSVYHDPGIRSAFLSHLMAKARVQGQLRKFWLSGTDFKRVAWGGKG